MQTNDQELVIWACYRHQPTRALRPSLCQKQRTATSQSLEMT